ncbi:D-amino-acid transaminase [Treponema sp.]
MNIQTANFSHWAFVKDKIVSREEACTDIEDRGYQFGDGAYEVIRVYGGKTFYEKEHLLRMERSLKELRIPFPNGLERLSTATSALIQAEGIEDGIVYLQVTRGAAKRVHQFPSPPSEAILTGTASSLARPKENVEKGVRVLLTRDLRWARNDIKSLNLLGSVLSKQDAKDASCFEAVLHRDGLLTEGSSSNLFILKYGRLQTHPANNFILAGITRDIIISLAKQAGLGVQEKDFTIEEMLGAEEVFLTGTTTEVMPVTSVLVEGKERRIAGGLIGKTSRSLQEGLEKLFGGVHP